MDVLTTWTGLTGFTDGHLTLVSLEVAVVAAQGLGHAVGEVAPRPGALARHGLPVVLEGSRGVILNALSFAIRADTQMIST